MKLSVLNNGSIIDNPAKSGDAGYDIHAISEPIVHGHMHHQGFYRTVYYIEYNTKLNVQPDIDLDFYTFYLLLYPRSSIVKTNLVLANSVGVIDSGYNGDIKVCFKYISQPEDLKIISGNNIEGDKSSGILTSINPQRIYHKGDKIAQLIPTKHNAMNIEMVESLVDTERSSGGFGSTDKK